MQMNEEVQSAKVWQRAEDIDWFLAASQLIQQIPSVTKKQRLDDESQAQSSIEEAQNNDLTSSKFVNLDLNPLTEEKISTNLKKVESDVELREFAKGIYQTIENQLYSTTFTHQEGKAKSAEPIITRDMVAACKYFVNQHPQVAFKFVFLQLLSNGSRAGCELVERVLDSKKIDAYLDDFLQSCEKVSGPLCPSEDALLFWHRSVFSHGNLPVSLLSRLINELGTIPKESSRVSGAIFALTKSNASILSPFASVLLAMLNNASGVMVGPARKALQALLKNGK